MRRWMWLLIGALLVVSLACSFLPFGKDDDDDAGVPGVVATVGAVIEEGGVEKPESGGGDEGPSDDDDGDDGEVLSVDADALEQLESYRAVLTYHIESSDGTVEELRIEESATRDPAAEHYVMSSEDGDVEMIQIGKDSWIRFGEDWMMSTSDEDVGFGDMLSSGDDWISDVEDSDYEYLGRENINGIDTRHYRVEYDEGLLGGLLGEEEDMSDVESGTADVWIADERDLPKFAVKYEIVMTGTDEDNNDVSLTMQQEIFDVNEPFTIEPPEGVGGMPADLPEYPGATDMMSMGTMTMFTVTDDVETVNAFYVNALESGGWTEDEDSMVSAEVASSTWQKDGQTLSLLVSSGDDGTSVMISIEE